MITGARFFTGSVLALELIAHASQPIPYIASEWWGVALNPELGEFGSDKQEPVDFAIWRALDGSWQVLSCIRNTKCGGHGRLLYRWEGRAVTETNWLPQGIAMMAEVKLGEEPGGLQAPFVFREQDKFFMFYGDWNRICLATSQDGKTFARKLNERGQPDLFSGPYDNSRDPMVLKRDGIYYCYYTGHKQGAEFQAAIFCRTSADLEHWSEPILVCAGGSPARLGIWFGADAECPFVVERDGSYYLFRNQIYGPGNVNTQYESRNLLDFGVGTDRCRIGTLPVAAPEIFCDQGQWFIATLNPTLDGIRIARLGWR